MMTEQKMKQAWDILRNQLFCEKTNLIYDSLSSHDPLHRFGHLPYPEEIALQLPNPAGWGTGMEDSMLNAGSALEAALLRAESEPSNRSELLVFARKIVDGMEACATAHGRKGYVVRSISPRDGHSCYINSSRDQFTLYVYGLWRYFHSKLIDAAERKRAVRLLTETAEYCEKTVLSERESNLLRLDGKPGLVCEMLRVEPHEAMRLPMIYAAARDASGSAHWRELYLRYAEQGLAETLAMDQEKPWWSLQLMQMQISLALCRETEADRQMLEQYGRAMEITARLAEKHFYEEEKKMREFRGSWSPFAVHWSRAWKMTLRKESLHPGKPALCYGYLCLKPWESAEFMDAFERLRGIGNLAVSIFLCPGYRFAEDFPQRFAAAVSIPDYAVHTTGGVVNILHAWWLARSRGIITNSKE